MYSTQTFKAYSTFADLSCSGPYNNLFERESIDFVICLLVITLNAER